MAAEKSILAVIWASRTSFRNNHDKVAFAVHASFLASGYILTATGPQAFSDSALTDPSTDEVSLDHWNEVEGEYAFAYANPEKNMMKVLVKCLAMNDKLPVNALSEMSSDPVHLEIRVEDYIAEDGSNKYSEQFKNLGKLVNSLDVEVFSKFNSFSVSGSSSNDRRSSKWERTSTSTQPSTASGSLTARVEQVEHLVQKFLSYHQSFRSYELPFMSYHAAYVNMFNQYVRHLIPPGVNLPPFPHAPAIPPALASKPMDDDEETMETGKTVLAVIRAARPAFCNNHDKVAFAVHASFLTMGYILTATGPRALSDGALSDPSTGPIDEDPVDHWNEVEGKYAFLYANPENNLKKVLVKCLAMNDKLPVDALSEGSSNPVHFEIRVGDYIVEDNEEHGHNNYSDLFKNLGKLMNSLDVEVLSKLDSSSISVSSSNDSRSSKRKRTSASTQPSTTSMDSLIARIERLEHSVLSFMLDQLSFMSSRAAFNKELAQYVFHLVPPGVDLPPFPQAPEVPSAVALEPMDDDDDDEEEEEEEDDYDEELEKEQVKHSIQAYTSHHLSFLSYQAAYNNVLAQYMRHLVLPGVDLPPFPQAPIVPHALVPELMDDDDKKEEDDVEGEEDEL